MVLLVGLEHVVLDVGQEFAHPRVHDLVLDVGVHGQQLDDPLDRSAPLRRSRGPRPSRSLGRLLRISLCSSLSRTMASVDMGLLGFGGACPYPTACSPCGQPPASRPTSHRTPTLGARRGWSGGRGVRRETCVEEGPGSEGQGGGQHPPGATRGTVPQRTDRPKPTPASVVDADGGAGKGETVVQETTSDPGDRIGSVNPARSKVEQRTLEGCPPECAGRPHETVGNGGPRWMVAERVRRKAPGNRTRPTDQPLRLTPSDLRKRASEGGVDPR